MANFYIGQEVEVRGYLTPDGKPFMGWDEAKIVNAEGIYNEPRSYRVQYLGGTSAVRNVADIRAVEGDAATDLTEQSRDRHSQRRTYAHAVHQQILKDLTND